MPVVNSRDVAEMFEKDHRHVLRDIDKLLDCPDLGTQAISKGCWQAQWFRLSHWQDAQNKTQRSFDMTRDGFTLLVMGWIGEKAMAFKVAYIQAFNAMEAALRAEKPREHEVFLEAVRTTVRELAAPLAGRHGGNFPAHS